MHKEQLEILAAMAGIKGLEGLDIPVESLPDDKELAAASAVFMASLDAEFEAMTSALQSEMTPPDEVVMVSGEGPANAKSSVADSPLPVPSMARSRRTTIRIPAPVLRAYKDKAASVGMGYQTLIIRTLKSAMKTW